MAEIHYLISDASKKVDVESHVLRYWEEELELEIPRNEMGHRYYTEFHIRLFRQIKELKEKGYQLKAIKNALDKMTGVMGEIVVSEDIMEEDMKTAWKDSKNEPDSKETGISKVEPAQAQIVINEEKMEQFQTIMNHVIGQALDANREKLSNDVGEIVSDKVMKEFEYLMRVNDEKEEERFKQLDETIRSYQKSGKGRAEAAALQDECGCRGLRALIGVRHASLLGLWVLLRGYTHHATGDEQKAGGRTGRPAAERTWWRCGESNSGPKQVPDRCLQAQLPVRSQLPRTR